MSRSRALIGTCEPECYRWHGCSRQRWLHCRAVGASGSRSAPARPVLRLKRHLTRQNGIGVENVPVSWFSNFAEVSHAEPAAQRWKNFHCSSILNDDSEVLINAGDRAQTHLWKILRKTDKAVFILPKLLENFRKEASVKFPVHEFSTQTPIATSVPTNLHFLQFSRQETFIIFSGVLNRPCL